MFILFGFLKNSKPRTVLNPGIVESLAGLHIAIDIVLSTYKPKDRITHKKINRLINGKSIAILPLDDNQTALVFGVSPYIQKYLDGYVWANNISQKDNSYVLQEHPGHETTARLLFSQFGLYKLNDPDYLSTKFSHCHSDYEIYP